MNITYSELLNICQSHLVAMADELINKGRADAIDELFCVITYEDYQQIVDKIIKQYSQPRRKGKYNLNYLIFNEFMALICKKLKEQTNE